LSEDKKVPTILDDGFGIEDTTPILQEALPKAQVLGVDDSPRDQPAVLKKRFMRRCVLVAS